MPTDPEVRRRLGALMEERRLELGLRWQDVAEHGGVSLKALHSARTGNASIRPLTQQAIENGLRWQHGSIQRVIDGGDPVAASIERTPVIATGSAALPPLAVADYATAADTATATEYADDMDVTAAVVRAAIHPLERQIWEEVNRHPEGSAAAVIFTDPVERALWGREDIPESERIKYVAALRAVSRNPAARRATKRSA